MLKFVVLSHFLFFMFYQASITANENEINIQWQDKKISIKAKGVSVCKVLEELAKKTNTKVRNKNKCDNLITLNIDKKSIDEAVKKILRHDSYALVDHDTERELIILNRNREQHGDGTAALNHGVSKENYIPAPSQPDTTNKIQIQEPLGYYQGTSSIPVSETAVMSADTNDISEITDNRLSTHPEPEPIAYPTSPPFDPAELDSGLAADVPAPDPNKVFVNPR